ncbi:phosphotransferase [Curtobacterium sp. VKM Ac-2922]|uniref:phosphotransferase n=1 Tax=Curtobacterium sp. VKM Ac-2922 TaxID=2929475 RepID=UPI001FB335C9|nr:phosphotransferase [Curtobacterium sp. VKM Ac-2922]MCJ1715520.1 phosphotransferase [Curtobacterium sp. VKM Ac-2922]
MGITMLWETTDAALALRDRFGFATEDDAATWAIATVRTHWGVAATACSRIVMSDRNALAWLDTDDDPVLLKWCVESSRFPRLAAAADVVAWLGDRGLPVSAPVPALDGSVQVEVDGVSAGLQRVLVGELLDVDDPAAVRSVGRVVAELHDALVPYPAAGAVAAVRPTPAPLTSQVQQWLEGAPVHLPSDGLELLRTLLGALPAEPLPVQVVHGDVRSANVLCADGRVVGLVDFEDLRVDHRVVELARAAVLLGTRFHDWAPVGADVQAAFRQAYESVSPLSSVEAAWWDVLVLWTSLAFVPPGDDPTGWGAAAAEQVRRLSG